jgi:putative ABC transport system permease protein
VGVAMGLAASVGLTRWMASLLFEISAIDPVTYGVVAVALGGAAVAACWLPARRASGLDPMTALREDG